MIEYCYSGLFAGHELFFSFRHPDTVRYFGSWLKPLTVSNEKCLRVPFADTREWEEMWARPDDGFTEYGLSLFRASDALLAHNACVFHGVAFLWRGRSFLLTAPSGIGKSTQLFNLLELCGTDIRVMNGDKPILKREGGQIWVYPSPWKGKERLGDDTLTAPLGGIVYLEQAKSNSIIRLAAHDSVPLLLSRFLSTFETSEQVLQVCALEELMLRSIPVLKLYNLGDMASTRLMRDSLLREVFHDEI